MNSVNVNRLKKELEMFASSPPTGISCVASNDSLDTFTAQIIGAPETPYQDGIFELEIQVPPRYPFDPPRVRFLTPIYHPNIDTSGRICLDTLKLPPKGTWRPCLNLSTVLMMIRVLMAEPGSEDPLMTDIWQEFKYNFTTYMEKARNWTKLYASNGSSLAKAPWNESSKGKVGCDEAPVDDTKMTHISPKNHKIKNMHALDANSFEKPSNKRNGNNSLADISNKRIKFANNDIST